METSIQQRWISSRHGWSAIWQSAPNPRLRASTKGYVTVGLSVKLAVSGPSAWDGRSSKAANARRATPGAAAPVPHALLGERPGARYRVNMHQPSWRQCAESGQIYVRNRPKPDTSPWPEGSVRFSPLPLGSGPSANGYIGPPGSHLRPVG